jgi:hypothetical protein
MKKKPDSNSDSKSYRGIRLYRDDIDLMLSEFHDNEFETRIADREFEYESLDDLINKRGIAPSHIEIDGKHKDEGYEAASITFERDRVYVHSHNLRERPAYIVFTKIGQICATRGSKLYKILNPWFYYFPLMAFVGLLFPAFVQFKSQTPTIVCLVAIVAFLILSVVSSTYRHYQHQVILRQRHEGGFWKQNSDKIWLLIIGALVGIFLKYLLEILMKLM